MTVQSVFVPTDDKELLARLRDAFKKVTAPASGLPTPSYIGIMLKYFVANLLLRQGQVEEAAKSAKELLKEIRGYFGHDMSELSLDPALILLHQKFEAFTSVDPATMQTAEQQQRLQAQQVEILAAAEELEKKTLQLQGDKSERLVEVYCLYSFFELQGGNFEGGMELQRKATRISLQASVGKQNLVQHKAGRSGFNPPPVVSTRSNKFQAVCVGLLGRGASIYQPLIPIGVAVMLMQQKVFMITLENDHCPTSALLQTHGHTRI